MTNPLRLAVFSSSDFIVPMIESISQAYGSSIYSLLSPSFIQTYNCHIPQFHCPIQLEYIVSQPDRLNRSKVIQNPVAAYARSQGITLFTPAKINKEYSQFQSELASTDMVITASFGQIISARILQLPRYGIINWHPSDLPAYRGATPMQSALRDGCTATALCWIEMEKGMDSGAVLARYQHQIAPGDTIVELITAMSAYGMQTWAEAVARQILYRNGLVEPKIQNENMATFCGQLSKDDAWVDTTQHTATDIYNHWRAYRLFPGTRCRTDHFVACKLLSVELPVAHVSGGTVYEDTQWIQTIHHKNRQTYLKCADNSFLPVTDIQLENGKKIQLHGYTRFL